MESRTADPPAEDGGIRLDGVGINVTGRKSAAQAARSLEERFRAVVEQVADGIALFGADSVILFASRASQRMLGYEPEEMVGHSCFDLIHPDDQARVRDLFAECLARPAGETKVEYRYRHKDGSWRLLETTGSNRLDDPAVAVVTVGWALPPATCENLRRLPVLRAEVK